ADLPEKHPPALPGLPGRLAVPPQRHESLGAVAGQPGAHQLAAKPPGPPAPRGAGSGPARPEPRRPTAWWSLSLVQLHHPADRPGNGDPAPGLQPARDSARPSGLLCTRIAAGLCELAGQAAQDRARGRAVAGARANVEHRRPEASDFLETVEFTAIDFLAEDPQRDAAIQARFGPQVAELVRRDRQQNVRRAFRSFPLHELPLAQRTINPYAFY